MQHKPTILCFMFGQWIPCSRELALDHYALSFAAALCRADNHEGCVITERADGSAFCSYCGALIRRSRADEDRAVDDAIRSGVPAYMFMSSQRNGR